MLDIGFWEILVLAALALLILGPERLPQVVRTVGRWVRAVKRTATQLRWQIEQELDVNEKPRSPRSPPHSRTAGTRSSSGANAAGTSPRPPDGLTQRVSHPEKGAAGQAEAGEAAMEEGATIASPTPRPVAGVHDPAGGAEETPAEEAPPRESEPSRSETSTH